MDKDNNYENEADSEPKRSFFNMFVAYVPFLVFSLIFLFSSLSVQKVLTFILNAFRKIKLFIWKLRGHTPESMVEERIVYGKSWEEFCDTLKSAGASLIYGNVS